MIEIETKCGKLFGNDKPFCHEFLGVPFATSKRFEYSKLIKKWSKEIDASKPGATPMQKRAYPEFEHLENPERLFYHREYREGISFDYKEGVLTLNIFTPKEKGNYPVLLYFHGGGFDSGSINESPFNGEEYAKRGIVVVFASYRVSAFGYLSHEEIQKQFGRDGNFGLDDQLNALRWVNQNIDSFYGDPKQITLMGQSAGAIAIQYLLCNHEYDSFYLRAIMMSGGGMFPKFALPKKAEDCHQYWNEVIALSGCKSFEEFKAADPKIVLAAIDKQRGLRKDNSYNTMPVIDGVIIPKRIDEVIDKAANKDVILGFTNNDMYAPIMAYIGLKYASKHNAYAYYFDIDAKGDKNKAFHSSDLHYAFGTLKKSWRPYNEKDEVASNTLISYFANFIKSGNPNGENLIQWNKGKGKSLFIQEEGCHMGRPPLLKMARNFLGGGPK